MFRLVYAKGVLKDAKNMDPNELMKIKKGIEELRNFPHIPKIKHLTNHPIADFRLRIGNYRILFDVDWKNREIDILKIGHRRDIY